MSIYEYVIRLSQSISLVYLGRYSLKDKVHQILYICKGGQCQQSTVNMLVYSIDKDVFNLKQKCKIYHCFEYLINGVFQESLLRSKFKYKLEIHTQLDQHRAQFEECYFISVMLWLKGVCETKLNNKTNKLLISNE